MRGHVGVADYHSNVGQIDPEGLGRDHGEARSRRGEVDGAQGQGYGAVGAEGYMAARRAAWHRPHAQGYAATTVGPLQLARPAGMGADLREHLLEADRGKPHAVGHGIAVDRDVLQSEFDGVVTKGFADLVDDRLQGEIRGGCPRRAVGRDVGLVSHDVEGVNSHVGGPVVGVDPSYCRAQRRARECAGVVEQPGLYGDNRAILPGPDLDRRHEGVSRPGSPENLLAGQSQTHRQTGPSRQRHADGRYPDGLFSAEPAAYLRGNDLDLAEGNA